MRRRSIALLAGAAALAAAGVLLAPGAGAEYFGRLIHQENSLYHRIFVYQQGERVTLRFGAQDQRFIQSQVDLGAPRRHVNEYTAMAFAGLLYNPEPERVLVLGLGGGVIPRDLRHYYPEARIDVAEIDPAVPPIARRYFGFRTDERLQVHVMDGRVFAKRQLARDPAPKYDLVVLDAYRGDYVPFHLMTREFLQELRGVLAADGVVVSNVITTNRLFDAELKTFLAVFGRCQVYVGSYSTNAMLIGPGPEAPTLGVAEAARRAEGLQRARGFAFDMRWVAGRLSLGVRPDPRAQVLTDDRAPVNWLREQEADRPRAQ